MLRKVITGAAIVAAVGGIALIASQHAKAASAYNGCHIGGAVGYSSALTEATALVPGGSINVDSLGADGVTWTGFVGCDLAVANKWVVGGWAEYGWDDDVEFSVTTSATPALLQASLDNHWAIGGRVGYEVVNGALVYALLGYTQAEVSNLTSPFAGASFSVPTLDGYVVGGGAEFALGGGLFLQAQYAYYDYQSQNIPIVGPISVDLDTDVHAVRLGVLYRMNFSSSLPQFEASKPLK